MPCRVCFVRQIEPCMSCGLSRGWNQSVTESIRQRHPKWQSVKKGHRQPHTKENLTKSITSVEPRVQFEPHTLLFGEVLPLLGFHDQTGQLCRAVAQYGTQVTDELVHKPLPWYLRRAQRAGVSSGTGRSEHGQRWRTWWAPPTSPVSAGTKTVRMIGQARIKASSHHHRARQGKTRQDRTRQDRTRQDKTRQDKVGQTIVTYQQGKSQEFRIGQNRKFTIVVSYANQEPARHVVWQ